MSNSKILTSDEVTEIEAQFERLLSALTFDEPRRGNRYVESVDGDYYFEEHVDNEFEAFDLLRRCPALCATVRHLLEEVTRLKNELSGEHALDLITDRHLKANVNDAIERLK